MTITFAWHLLTLCATALAGGGAVAFVIWRATDQAWRRGYAEGHRTGVRHAWNAQDQLADDVIQLIPHLDPTRLPPGA